jgi:DNA-binding NarL/FixJ family response regulator
MPAETRWNPVVTDPLELMPLRIVVVDDNAVMLRAVVDALEEVDGVRVDGAATSVQEGLHMVRAIEPDAVLLDVNMPGGGGWELARQLRRSAPTTRAVAHSAYRTPLIMRTLAAAGVAAFVDKGAPVEEIIDALVGSGAHQAPLGAGALE